MEAMSEAQQGPFQDLSTAVTHPIDTSHLTQPMFDEEDPVPPTLNSFGAQETSKRGTRRKQSTSSSASTKSTPAAVRRQQALGRFTAACTIPCYASFWTRLPCQNILALFKSNEVQHFLFFVYCRFCVS